MSSKTFTEENTPVRTLIVENFEESGITETDLRDYFESFGEIVSTMIFKSNSTYLYWCESFAIIIYKESESVTKVLAQDIHTIKLKELLIKIAPNWLQPEFFEDVKQPVDHFSNIDIPNNSVLTLNDDCLLYMLSLLNLSDQIKLSELCPRLSNIGDLEFVRTKKLYFYDKQFETAKELKNMFQKVGKYIKYITFLGSDRGFVHRDILIPSQCIAYFIPYLCPNLTTLQFNMIYLNCSIIKWLMPALKGLESLALRSCDITDDMVTILQSCTKLEKLDLSSNMMITGVGFETLSKTIMNLNISFCYNIESEHLTKLFKVAKFKKISFSELDDIVDLEELSKLESLEAISFCNTVTVDFSVIASFSNLKDLFINCAMIDLNDRFFEALRNEKSNVMERLWLPGAPLNDFRKKVICNFKNLKDLCIMADDDFLTELTNKNVNLTSLHLFGSAKISDTALLNFVHKSENIKTIDITSCKQFGNSFVQKLLEKLINLRRRTRLELYVARTKIRYPLHINESHPIYNDFERLLKLSDDMVLRGISIHDDGIRRSGYDYGYEYGTDNEKESDGL